MEEGGRNGMEQYNAATIEKHAFDIAKKRLGDVEKGIIVEIGGRKVIVESHYLAFEYAKKRREQEQYDDKPKWQLSDGDHIAPYPLDPFR